MEQTSKSKKSAIRVIQFVVMAVMYGVVMWMLDSFFDSDYKYTPRSIVVQSICFSAIYCLWSWWSENRKKRKSNK